MAEGAGARIGVAALLAVVLVVAIALARGWRAGDGSPGAGAPGSMSAGPVPAAAGGGAAGEALSEGFLGVIVGGPRESAPTLLCDESNWPRLGTLIREVGPGEVRVDEPGWARQGTSARAGIASWVSKCQLDGGPLRVVGAESGELLGTYDAGEGFRSAS